jgi:2-keto-4-pentenoate hydratase/2-oxohepta-3-ene-1,7-dioic acid hydratase in catechol pathway
MKIRKLLTPLVPTDIFCIGLNYMKHYEEGAKKRGVPLPEKPPVWLAPSTSLLNPDEDIWMPALQHGDQLDWECELTIVIGKACRNVKKEVALDYVLGYTVGIDVSCRHWQRNAGASQWTKGKAFDTFKPLGPVLVASQAIPDPQNLQLMTRVNGETQQNENTSDMIFTCAEIIEWLSDNQTLAAGSVIMTGTPSGVAAGRSPPNYLVVGDTLECEIDGIGVLRHPIASAPN